MKTLKTLFLSLFVVAFVASCDDSTLIDDSEDILTGNAILGGLIDVGNPLISYVVGSGNTYTASGQIKQGTVPTTAVDIYKSFTDVVSGASSDKVLLTSVAVTDTNPGDIVNFSFDFTYESLSSGLTVNGSPLPTDDGGLNIADSWSLEYRSMTAEGETVVNANTTKVAVGTRYAGIYTVMESAYWNSGSLQGGNWNGEDRIIESVDATIYRHVGLAYWDDNEFFFTVDNTTGYITILPEDLEGSALLLNGSPVMTCEGAGGNFENLTCDSSTSFALPDDVGGEDQLTFTVGYFRGVGATREFLEVLVKQVD